MKIGFTYDLKREPDISLGETEEMFAEFDDIETIEEIESAIVSGGHSVLRIGGGIELLKKSGTLARECALVFNIAEGLWTRSREAQVPAALEILNIPFTGSDPLGLALTLDKTMTKKILLYHNINTARFYETGDTKDGFRDFCLNFPVIIKPSREGTSKGIEKESVAYEIDYLKKRSALMIEKYRQPVLIEEFIFGREFTVFVTGNGLPLAYPPVQIIINGRTDLGMDFYSHDRLADPALEYRCPSSEPSSLLLELESVSVKAFTALGLRDFARFDYRVDKEGRPVFLECNPLPNLGKMDVVPLIAAATGKRYENIILGIVNDACKRYGIEINS